LVAAAPFITFVRDTAVKHGIVGTIGQLTVSPGAPNVIPGKVELIVEIRGLEAAILDQAAQEMAAWMANVAGSFVSVADKAAVQSDPRVIAAMTAACHQLGLSYKGMPSGAGHDAMNISYLCPQGMLFVPSQGGVSHSPDEYTKPEDCINGAQVLLATLVALDELLD
jgi:N-carbamoyl-L-amino-acid hydrolase